MSRLSELDPFRTSTKPSHKSPSSKDTSNIPQSPHSSNTAYSASFLNNQSKNLKFTYPTTYKPNHITSFTHQKTSNNDLKKHPISYQNFSLKYSPPKSQSEKVTPIKAFTPISTSNTPFTPKKSTSSYKKFQPKGLSYLEMTQPFAQSYSHSSHTPREEIESLKSVEIEIKDRLAKNYSVKHSPASSPWIKTLKSPSSSQGTPQLRAQTINTDILRISLEKQLDKGFKKRNPSSQIGTPTITDMSDFAESIISQFEHRTKIIEQSENLISKYSSPKAVGYNKHLISKKNSTNSSALQSPKASRQRSVNKQIDFDVESLRLKESENNTPQKKQWNPLPEDEEVLYLDPEDNEEVIKENSKEEESRQEGRSSRLESSFKGMDMSRESPELSNKTSTLEVLFDAEKKDKTVSSKEIITSELPTPEFSKVLISRSGSMNIYDTLKKRKPSHLKIDSKNLESSPENSKDYELKKPEGSSPDVSSPIRNKVKSIDNIQQAILKESFVEEEEEFSLKKRGGVNKLRIEEPQQMKETPRFPSGRGPKKSLKKSESLENKDLVQEQETVNNIKEAGYTKKLSEKLEEKLMELRLGKPEALKKVEGRRGYQIEPMENEQEEEKSEGLNVSLGKEESLSYEEPAKTFVEEINENNVEEDFEKNEEIKNSLKKVGNDKKETVALAPGSSFKETVENGDSEKSEEKVIYKSEDARSEHSDEKTEIKETEPMNIALAFDNKSTIFERKNQGQVQENMSSLKENHENSPKSENKSARTKEEISPSVEEGIQIIAEKVILDYKKDGLKNTPQVDSQEKAVMIESKPVKEQFAFEELAQNESVNISQELPQKEPIHIEEDSKTENQSIENKDIFVQNSENSLIKTNEEEIIETDQVDSHERFSEIVPVQAKEEVAYPEELPQNKSIEVSEEFIREGYLHAKEGSSLRNEGIKTRAKISFPQSSEIQLAPSKQEANSFVETNRPAKEENRLVTQEIEINVQKESERVEDTQANLEEKTLSMEVKEEVFSLGGVAENRSIDISHQELTQDGPVDVKENVSIIQQKSGKDKELVQNESVNISYQELIQEGSIDAEKNPNAENKRSKRELAENSFVLRGEEIVSSQDTTPANEEGSQKVELDLQKEGQVKADSQEKSLIAETKPVKEEVLLMEELVQNGSVNISQKLIEDESVNIEEKAYAENERNESESKAQSLENDLTQNKQETSFTQNFSFLAGFESQIIPKKAEINSQKESVNEQPSSQEKAASSNQQTETKEEIIDFEEFAQVKSIDVSQELTQEQPLQKPKTDNKTFKLEPETSFTQNFSLVNSQIIPNKVNIPSSNQPFSLNTETNFQQLEENESVEIEATKPLSEQNITFSEFKLPHPSSEISLSEEPTQKLTPPVVSQEKLPTTPKELPQNTQQEVPLFHSQSQESSSSPKAKRAINQKPKSSSHFKSLSLDLPSYSPEQHNTPTRPQEIALLSSVVINDSPKKVSLMKKGIIVMDDNMTEGSNHQEDPNFCKEYYTDSRVSESCSFQDIDESSRENSPSRCELISFEEFSLVPKDNRKSQTSPKRPNIQLYYEEKSQEKIEKKRSTKESIEINVSQVPFNVSNTAFSAFSGDFNVSSITKNEQEISGKNLSFFTGEQQQTEISQTFDQNISPINAPKYFFSQELGRKLSSFALSRGLGELEGRPSNLQVSEGEKGGFMEPKSLGNSGEFQRVAAEKESKSLMKMISTLESIDRESDHSVNVDSFILPSNLSLPKTQELKMSTGDFDIQGGSQGENESQGSSPEISFNGGKSVIPMMKFENLKTEFENISLTGSIIVFDNNIYYANNVVNNNKELEKRPLDDLNPVTEERSLEMTQSEETKSEAKTDSLTETQQQLQEENDHIALNKNLTQENALKKTGVMGFSFPKLQQELKISTEDFEENDEIQGENEEKSSIIENSVEVSNGEIPVMKFEDLKTDFNKISLTGSMIVFDNNLYYSNNEEKKELEKQALDDLDAVIEERSLEMTQSEEANSEAKSDSFTETEQQQEDEIAINKALAQENMIILQENALEKYFKNVKLPNLPFPKLHQNLKISTEDPEDSDEQNLTQEKSSEIETGEIPVMKFENFKTDFEKISLTGSMIVFDNNLYYSKNENTKELETQPLDDPNIVIEERSLEMTQSEETASEAKGNSFIEAKQQHENELALNKILAKENMMILQENALKKYFTKMRASLEKMQSEDTLSENSLSEQFAINKSLAKENMMILQESALERYFKNAQSLLPSKETMSQNSLTEAEQQDDIELALNKSLAKENMVVLQESALEKYFKNVRSYLGKTQSEQTCSENSYTETQQQLALNKRLAKENMKILQENALNRYFKRMQPTNLFSKFKISDGETEQQLIINKSLAKENMRILQKTSLEKYFKMTRSSFASFEKMQSEESSSEDSLTESQQQQDDDLILNKSLAKENMIILQENALEKYFKNVRPSLENPQSEETESENSLSETEEQLAINKSLAKENMMILQDNALDRYFKRMQPTNPFEQQLALNKSLAKENMVILQENALERYFKNVQPTTPFLKFEQQLMINKSLAKENMMILQDNALDRYFKRMQPTNPFEQQLALNKSLAKENMMILQENALEKYFKNVRPSLENPQSEETESESSISEIEDQLAINKNLAKEIMMILQEKALEKYFKNQLSLEKMLSEGSNSENSLAEAQQQQDEDLRLNKTLAKENVILLQKSALKKFFKSVRPSLEKTQSEETYSEDSLPETEDQLAVNKSLAKETMRILQENALEKYFKNMRPPLEKTQSQESNSENSFIEVQQELAINRSLAKENMMILQENALEKYFKKTRFSLEKTQSEKTLSKNSLTETQQQQDEDLRLNKTLAKENVTLLQENALNKYFESIRSTNLPLHKIPELKVSPMNFDLQGKQRENDSQGSTPEESLDVAKEMEKVNITSPVLVLENHSSYSNNLMNEELEMWALGDLSPVCEERSCEIICSEANSPTTTQQQPENDLAINKTLAKEAVFIIQENALKKFFDNATSHKASELKISPINIDLQEENDSQNSTPEETPNIEKEMTKINLTSSIIIPDNPLFYSNPLKSEEFEIWALGNLSPVCEEKSCEITCSEANSPSAIRQPQENNLTMKTLTKENVIFLQENNAFKRNSKNAGSLNFPPPKTQDFTISSGDIDLQEAHELHSNTPGRLSGAGRSPVPMMKFENLKADFESISLTGSIVLDSKLHPVTEEQFLQSEEVRETPLTATFHNQLDNEILLFNKKLAKENVIIIQENALRKFFNSSQPSIPETMTFRSRAIDSDRANQKPSIEDLQEKKSNPKVLKPLMSFGGNEDEEEAKSLILPTDLSAQDPRNLSDISELESLNNSIATPKITASPLAGPKSHEADSDALKESIFLNSHSPYHGNMNTQEDRLPTFGSSILKQPTINSIMSSGPEKPLSDHNQSISGSTESHNDSPTKQSQPVKFRNSSLFKGFTMAQTLMMPPDLGFSSPMSIDKGQFNHPPTIARHTSVPSDQDSNHKRPSKMSASTSNLFRLTPLDGTADLLEERKSIDTRGSHQRSLQYEKTKSIRRSFLHKNLLQSQFSTEEIMANNSHNKHQTGGRNRENLSNNTAKSSGEVSERFSLSDISLSMLQNEELNLSNNGDISGEIAPQEDFLKSLNFNDSLLLPGQLTRNGSLEDLQYDVSAVYNENIGRIETYKKLGNQAGCIKLLKELAHEVEKQEKEEGEESPDNQKEMINYKFYKIQIYNMLSLEYYEMKSFEEALEFTNKVIDLDRYNIQALYKSYQIHIKLKKDAEAKSIIKRVRKLMQFQPMSGSFQHMKLDNISIPSALSSSTNGSFYEGLQNMGSSLAFAKMNGGDWGKSLSRFKLQHTPVKNDQASNSGKE